MITRDKIIKDNAQIQHLLNIINGVSNDEMTDEEFIKALTEAVYDLQEFLIRKTWGL